MNFDAPRVKHAGFVYLFKRQDGLIKIGCTKTIAHRLKVMNAKYDGVHLVHLIESDDIFGLEFYLHLRYEKRRVEGEWFALTRKDIKELRQYTKISAKDIRHNHKTTLFSFKLTGEMRARLKLLCEKTNRCRASLIVEALEKLLQQHKIYKTTPRYPLPNKPLVFTYLTHQGPFRAKAEPNL